ncbi:hypothetical protein D3C84_1165930 [compost metagenome]
MGTFSQNNTLNRRLLPLADVCTDRPTLTFGLIANDLNRLTVSLNQGSLDDCQNVTLTSTNLTADIDVNFDHVNYPKKRRRDRRPKPPT